MVNIPEQAVKVAIRGYASSKQHTFDGQIHDALTAAAPHMSGVKVKKLEWEQHHDVWRCDKHPEYEITRWWLDEEPKQLGHFEIEDALGADQFGTLEEAQAAAQADYEKRILSALEPSSARDQALEEAETQGNLKQWNIQDHLKTPGSIAEYLQAALDEGDSELLINAVSDVIRALKSQPAPHSQSLVIIESPYAGDIAANESYARTCLLDCLRRGEAPIASHLLHTQVLDDMQPDERELGIEAGLAWYRVADKCVVYTDRGVSGGMTKGIERANRYGVPVEYRTLNEGQEAGNE